MHRKDLLRPGLRFGWTWTQNDEPAADIRIETEREAILLIYRVRRYNTTEWKDIRQRVRITWTSCHLGGRRPWFICAVSANGHDCGRRVARL
jgi:hypothetical protein